MLMSFLIAVGFAILGGAIGVAAKHNARRAAAVAVLGGLIVSGGFVGFSLVQAATVERQADSAEWAREYGRCTELAGVNYSAVAKCRCLFKADGMKGPRRAGDFSDVGPKC